MRLGRQEDARIRPSLDETHVLELGKRLAQRAPPDREALGQLPLRRKAIARLVLALLDQGQQCADSPGFLLVTGCVWHSRSLLKG